MPVLRCFVFRDASVLPCFYCIPSTCSRTQQRYLVALFEKKDIDPIEKVQVCNLHNVYMDIKISRTRSTWQDWDFIRLNLVVCILKLNKYFVLK